MDALHTCTRVACKCLKDMLDTPRAGRRRRTPFEFEEWKRPALGKRFVLWRCCGSKEATPASSGRREASKGFPASASLRQRCESAGLPPASLFGRRRPPSSPRSPPRLKTPGRRSGAGKPRSKAAGRRQLPSVAAAEQACRRRRRRKRKALKQRPWGARPPAGLEASGARFSPPPSCWNFLRGVARKDAGERLQAREGGRAGETQRRLAAAVEEEALHPHGGRAAAHPAQAAAAAGAGSGGRGVSSCSGSWRGGSGGGQDQGAALLHHEDGGLRGAQGQVRVLHGGDGRGQGDRLSVPAGAGLERRDHAAAGAVQEPPGHPGRQVHPAEAAAPRPAARAPPPERLQLRLAGPRVQMEFKRHFCKQCWTLFLLITNLAKEITVQGRASVQPLELFLF